MNEWWNGLDALNKAFYIGAGVFSLLFLWQFISSLIGMAGEGVHVEVEADADVDIDGLDLDEVEGGAIEEAAESAAAFKVLSLRAILAFFTLFTWAGAMYMQDDTYGTASALIYAALWGLGAWLFVAALVYYIRKLAETGTQRVSTCVGTVGTVYLNIPANGAGEVRVTVSGVISRVAARGVGGMAIDAGTPVRVKRTLGPNAVEVELADE